MIDEVEQIRTPWLGLFGDRDQSIPVGDVEALRAALDATPVDHDIVRYAEGEHGFFCDKRPSYNAEAAADAWPRALQWFSAHLAG